MKHPGLESDCTRPAATTGTRVADLIDTVRSRVKEVGAGMASFTAAPRLPRVVRRAIQRTGRNSGWSKAPPVRVEVADEAREWVSSEMAERGDREGEEEAA